MFLRNFLNALLDLSNFEQAHASVEALSSSSSISICHVLLAPVQAASTACCVTRSAQLALTSHSAYAWSDFRVFYRACQPRHSVCDRCGSTSPTAHRVDLTG